ncbi:MAG: hypothetical protein U0T83_00460 [Bacteriovoracaceae bacterium]
MSELQVGKEVVSFCSKCRLNLSHIIVALKENGQVAKVKCNTCKALHSFKDPKRSHDTSRSQTTKKSRATKPLAEIWESLMKEHKNQSPKKYSMKTKFERGELIEHPNFGTGFVEDMLDADKIKVIFKQDIKTLIHNKDLSA